MAARESFKDVSSSYACGAGVCREPCLSLLDAKVVPSGAALASLAYFFLAQFGVKLSKWLKPLRHISDMVPS